MEQLLFDKPEATASADLHFPELVAVAAWYLWWQRRQLKKGEHIQPVGRAAMTIKALSTNFWHASDKRVERTKEEHRWVKPRHDFLKVNVDASFVEEDSAGAIGAVIIDEWGHFIAAATHYIPNVSDAATAESLALRNGLILAAHIGCSKLEAEADCQLVIEAVKDPVGFLGAQYATIFECGQIASEFGQIQFGLCKREANQVVDALAKEAYKTRSSSTWDNDPPSFITSLIVKDLSIL
ncbi:hypothetical protein ZWY2020_026954 [Hordeum vulgare]|nr:hypothetical protein ZWY2020_026954 [Hordeum vulgare]